MSQKQQHAHAWYQASRLQDSAALHDRSDLVLRHKKQAEREVFLLHLLDVEIESVYRRAKRYAIEYFKESDADLVYFEIKSIDFVGSIVGELVSVEVLAV